MRYVCSACDCTRLLPHGETDVRGELKRNCRGCASRHCVGSVASGDSVLENKGFWTNPYSEHRQSSRRASLCVHKAFVSLRFPCSWLSSGAFWIRRAYFMMLGMRMWPKGRHDRARSSEEGSCAVQVVQNVAGKHARGFGERALERLRTGFAENAMKRQRGSVRSGAMQVTWCIIARTVRKPPVVKQN